MCICKFIRNFANMIMTVMPQYDVRKNSKYFIYTHLRATVRLNIKTRVEKDDY